MIFGVEKKGGWVFESLNMVSPSWYSGEAYIAAPGGQGFSGGSFSSSGFSASFSSAFASAFASTGGGGGAGGGGSAGGGGGGGGGGAS